MKIITFDPVSLNEVVDLSNAPFLVEGEGDETTMIYFENTANRAKYRRITLAAASVTFTGACARIAGADRPGISS